jgi:hypothetical protein
MVSSQDDDPLLETLKHAPETGWQDGPVAALLVSATERIAIDCADDDSRTKVPDREPARDVMASRPGGAQRVMRFAPKRA